MYTVRISMKCMHVCAAQKAYLPISKLKIEPDFPSLADEIAEPHPDTCMNIKVAVFTVSEKSSNTIIHCNYTISSLQYLLYLDWQQPTCLFSQYGTRQNV